MTGSVKMWAARDDDESGSLWLTDAHPGCSGSYKSWVPESLCRWLPIDPCLLPEIKPGECRQVEIRLVPDDENQPAG